MFSIGCPRRFCTHWFAASYSCGLTGSNQIGIVRPYRMSTSAMLVPTSQAHCPPPLGLNEGNLSCGSSPAYEFATIVHCLRLELQLTTLALNFADANAGNSNAARIAMIAITTSSSISVKAFTLLSCSLLRGLWHLLAISPPVIRSANFFAFILRTFVVLKPPLTEGAFQRLVQIKNKIPGQSTEKTKKFLRPFLS